MNNENSIHSATLLLYFTHLKRGGGEIEFAPNYWSQKRSMPLLPWLPAQKKKRFPVAKRSPKESSPLKEPAKLSTVQKDTEADVTAKKKRSDDAKATAAKAENTATSPAVSQASMMHGHVHVKRDTAALAKTLQKSTKVKRETSSEDSEEEEEDGERMKIFFIVL